MPAAKKILTAIFLAICFTSWLQNAAPARTFNFSTLAGNSGYGSEDGTGPAARFNFPQGIASDNAGNLYVADTENNTIRKIDPNGVVTTLAGLAGNPGHADGVGTNAGFSMPRGIVCWQSNIFVADTANSIIRLITPAGQVSTIAGVAGFTGSSNGVNAGALFNYPGGIACDTNGILYVADTRNSTIRRIALSGTNWTVTTIAGSAGVATNGDGTNSVARFNQPSAIAVDSSGSLYVADTGNSAIRRIMPVSNNWVTTTLTTNLLATGIAVADSNNLYVACAGDDTLRKLSQSGSDWTAAIFAGSSGKSGSTDGTAAARFNFPGSIALATNGTLFVADSLNNTIRKIASDGTVSTFAGLAGGPGSTDGLQVQARFNAPLGLAFAADGNCYIADSQNNTIRRATAAGEVQTIAGVATNLPGTVDGDGTNAAFSNPVAVVVDGLSNVYVADSFNNEIRKITPSGTDWMVTTIAGRAGPVYYGSITNVIGGTTNVSMVLFGAASYTNYSGFGTNISGGVTNVFVVITNTPFYTNEISGSPQVEMLSTNSFTLSNAPTRLDGTGTNALFQHPTGLALDAAGNLYVADGGTNGVRIVSPGGSVTTLPNSLGNYFIGTNALSYQSSAVALDGAGNIYVADAINSVIREIAVDGSVATIIGAPGLSGNADGTNSRARFGAPVQLALDPQTNLLVVDSLESTIRKVSRSGTNWIVATIGGMANSPGDADGIGGQARFNGPGGIAVDGAGNLYIADTANNTIRFGQVLAGNVALQITISQNSVVVAWPASAAGFSLESTANILPPAVWVPVTNTPAAVGNQLVVTNMPSAAAAYFRLHHN